MSERSKVIDRLLKNRESREAYIGAKLKVLIPSQLRALRLKSQTPRQEDLADAAGMKQSRISAMETPGAVNFNLETLVRIAAALRVALVVKFVSFSEVLRWENTFSQDEFNVIRIDNDRDFLQPSPSTYSTLPKYAFHSPDTGTANRPSCISESLKGSAELPLLSGTGFYTRPQTKGGSLYEAFGGTAG